MSEKPPGDSVTVDQGPQMVTCATCGEKRPKDSSPCPHCGVK